MKPPNPLIALLGPAILSLSCAAIKFEVPGYKPEEKIFLSSLNTLPKTSEGEAKRDSLLKVYRFFEIVDKSLFQKLRILDVQADSAQIDSLVESFKSQKDLETRPDTPERNEWWEELWEKRANYCDENYRSPYFDQYWDLRAKPVLLYGIPDQEFVREETCWTDIPSPIAENCEVFYLHWINKGIFLALQDNNYDNHPDRFIPHLEYDLVKGTPDARTESLLRQKSNEAKYLTVAKPSFRPFEGVEKILKATFNLTSFPEVDKSYTVWLSAGIPLDQFQPDSTGLVTFRAEEIVYYREGSPTVVYMDSGLTVYISPEFSWFPIYRCYRLPSGNYSLTFTLKGASPSQLGMYQIEFQLPPTEVSKGTSDILLSLTAPRNQDSTIDRIVRKENIALMGDPSLVYSRGDTIFPYIEFTTDYFAPDSANKYNYSVYLTLYPLEKERKKPEVITGPLYVVKEGTSLPFPFSDKEKTKKGKKGYLIYSRNVTCTLTSQIFAESVQIPKTLPQDDYILVISIQDLNNKNGSILWSYRQIKVK